MPPFSRELIQKVARERGYSPELLEKTLRLLQVLQELGQDEFLRPRLHLRGGTAINLFLAEAPRLSVDADLNYVGSENRQVMINERPGLMERIRKIVLAHDYQLGRTGDDYALESQDFTYERVLGGRDKLKVEVNFLVRIPMLEPVEKTAIQLLDGVECTYLLSSPEEIYAGKVKALLERTAPQDLYDVYRMLRAGDLPGHERIRYLTTLFLATVPDDPRRIASAAIRWPDEREFRGTIQSLIHKGETPGLEDLRAVVEPYLESLLKWDSRQAKFLDAVMKGKAEGGLLFPEDKELAAKVGRHPALLWKIRNLDKAR